MWCVVCGQAEGAASSGGAGTWPLNSEGDSYLRLDTLPNRVVFQGLHAAVCDVWDSVGVGASPDVDLGSPLPHALRSV